MGFRDTGRHMVAAAVMVTTLALPDVAAAATAANNSNAIMPGGCSSPTDCSNKVHNGDGTIKRLFQANHITAISITQAVPGTVTKSGLVIVNGKTIATQAMSFGRTNLPGSVPMNGVFKRPTSVSFASDQLPAFVHMTNGRFDFAIIQSCGNLVLATPVAAVAQTTPQPAPTPAPVITISQTQTQSQTQSQPPAATPLPQTGTSAAGAVGTSVLLMAAMYYLRSRRGLLYALHRT